MLRAKYRILSGLGALTFVGLNEIAWVNLGRNWDREENRKEPGKDTVYLGCVQQNPRNICKRTKTEHPCATMLPCSKGKMTVITDFTNYSEA